MLYPTVNIDDLLDGRPPGRFIKIKPRLRRVPRPWAFGSHQWACWTGLLDCSPTGYGVTPFMAYDDWQAAQRLVAAKAERAKAWEALRAVPIKGYEIPLDEFTPPEPTIWQRLRESFWRAMFREPKCRQF